MPEKDQNQFEDRAKKFLYQWLIRAIRAFLLISLILFTISTIRFLFLDEPYPAWYGFSPTTTPTSPGKTLWDWLELLIIPIAIASFSWFQNEAENSKRRDQYEEAKRAEIDRKRQEIFENYLTKINKLSRQEEGKRTQSDLLDARIQTITTINQLDAMRNRLILKYLREYELLQVSDTDSQKISLENADFSFAELDGVNFDTIYLRESIFDNASLNGATFNNCRLMGAKFNDAQLIKAHFNDARLDSAKFIRANLTGAYFVFADLIYTQFESSMLVEANLRDINAQHTNFRGANLSNIVIERLSFSSCYFNDAIIRNVNLIQVDFMDSALADADFSRSILNIDSYKNSEIVKAKLPLKFRLQTIRERWKTS
ncbi:MAG: pentapeptide repeat-containing protein [Chloroflexota bacterium]